MQTTSDRFTDLSRGHVRPLSWQLRASFDKSFDNDITFFTLDQSLLDGPDILSPEDSNIISPWDKFEYQDYSDRVISMEVTRESTMPYSITQAFADVTLNNYDGFFNPGSSSPIGNYMLPGRPMRILMGFNGENLPQFVGISEKTPSIDRISRTVSFHLKDFLTYVLEKDITRTVILEDYKTYEILDYLFQLMGLLPEQYVLDTMYNNIVKFFYVEKGTKFSNIVKDLIGADMGRLYLDELGVIRFKNKFAYSNIPVMTFDDSNVIDYSDEGDNSVINSVKIKADVRGVVEYQSVWSSSETYLLEPGQTLQVWGQFDDPVTSATDPIYSDVEISDSYFRTTTDESGTTPYTDISLNSVDLFSKTVLMEFENTGSVDAYIVAIEYWGTPAKVVDPIIVEDKDQSSIDDLDEEYIYDIDNPYIQSASDARAIALYLLYSYANQSSVVNLEVKGNPALQLNDAIELDLDDFQGIYNVQKSTIILSENKMTHRLRVRTQFIGGFFILDMSLLDGPDVLSI